MRKFYLLAIMSLSALISVAQLPVAYYDFESNSDRTDFENAVEQYVNTGNSTFAKTGTSTINSGLGAGIFNGGTASGQAISVTNISSTSSDPGTGASSYLQFTINTSGFTGISIDMDVYSFGAGSTYPFLGVLVSYNGGASYTSLINGFNPQRDTWSSRSAVFSSLADNKTNLIIRVYGYHSNNNSISGFRIDNVTVYALGTVAGAGTRNMLNESALYTSNTSGLTGNMYARKDFTVTGAGTAVNLKPVKFTGVANGTGANITVTNNAVLNFNSGSLSYFIDSAHGQVPVSVLNIAGGTVNLNETLSCAGTINISSGSLELNGEILQLAGTIIKSGGSLNGADGMLNMTGTQAQTIPANLFTNNALMDLVVSNTSVSGVSLGGALDIYGSLSFTGTGKTLNTNNLLTLKSNASGTAEVMEIPVNGSGVALDYINGKVTVERYISPRKAWRFLSVPTNTTQTIKEAWQENQPANNTSLTGYGIQITGNMAGWAANGFDLYGGGNAAIKTYNTSSLAIWDAVPATTIPIKTNRGYMTFIRGDRTANAYNSTPTETVLRTTGTLYTGDQPAISVALNLFTAVGNPYASRLDLRNVDKSSLTDVFYVWDPKLGSMGGYQTFIPFLSNYFAFPGGGSYNPWFFPSNYVESGQAFFITTTSLGGSIVFKEDAKASGSSVVSKGGQITGKQLITGLYTVTAGTKNLVDMVINDYDNSYSRSIDHQDIKKIMNISESLSILSSDSMLIMDRKPWVYGADTIFLHLSGVKPGQYELGFLAKDLDLNLFTAYLQDSYTHSSTLLNLSDTIAYHFTVDNNAGSYDAARFKIVFKPVIASPLPATAFSAIRNSDATATVSWKAEKEIYISHYELEHSSTADNFQKIADVAPVSNNGSLAAYSYADLNAGPGDNYYRLRSVGISGDIQYSAIIKIAALKTVNTVSVYPNPVENRSMHLVISNKITGVYSLSLVNAAAQTFQLPAITVAEGQNEKTIQLPADIMPGIYQLLITDPAKQQQVISVFVR